MLSARKAALHAKMEPVMPFLRIRTRKRLTTVSEEHNHLNRTLKLAEHLPDINSLVVLVIIKSTFEILILTAQLAMPVAI